MHLRSFAPETLTSLACTPDGGYLAGGGEKGNVYIWETGSGRLLTSFSAHYKAHSSASHQLLSVEWQQPLNKESFVCRQCRL